MACGVPTHYEQQASTVELCCYIAATGVQDGVEIAVH
jgi:hypothetical protein